MSISNSGEGRRILAAFGLDRIATPLNAEQQEAVTAPLGNQLVLAGAGTGKTTVLTERFSHLVSHYDISPYAIMAVTFTNRAATEMRSRIDAALNRQLNGLWVGTFHSIALRMLRHHTAAAGLPAHFQILDRKDQQSLIKRMMKELGLGDDSIQPKEVSGFISRNKENCQRSADLAGGAHRSARSQMLVLYYQDYEARCEKEGLVDFSEILLRCYELLERHPEVLAKYQEQFIDVLVDEFQDINRIQYKWLQLLVGGAGRMMAVGDDDQSIYSWRGAQPDSMHTFLQQFSDVQLVHLEQNYRSVGNILNAANEVIAANTTRIGKTLRTERGCGEAIWLHEAQSEYDEADFIVEQMLRWQADKGYRYGDCAVLYRSNAQSRLIEQACLARNVPYKVYGGLRFFSRAEVKTAMSYLRLLVLPDADAVFGRVVNLPPRGIGTKTQALLRAWAEAKGVSLWAASTPAALAEQSLTARATRALLDFHELIDGLRETVKALPLPVAVAAVIKAAGLDTYYGAEAGEVGRSRQENLEELISASAKQVASDAAAERPTLEVLSEFLNAITLETSAESAGEGGEAQLPTDAFQLMTFHAAKGLEFPVVFLAGLEEGLLPHALSMYETDDLKADRRSLEEERRLLYVGITRAQERLCLSYAQERRLLGATSPRLPSQFLIEFPQHLLERRDAFGMPAL